MTWYSRLLQNDRKTSLRTSHRRRQRIDLERLEVRTVLSNVSAVFPAPLPFPPSTLLITADASNNNFVINEGPGAVVTVSPGTPAVKAGVGVIPPSTINTNAGSFTTVNPVSSIVVQLQGTSNFDIVTILGTGSAPTAPAVNNTTVTATGANVSLGVGFAYGNVVGLTPGVFNTGALTVSDLASSPTNGVLNTTINNSSFGSVSITQLGNGPDRSTVTMMGDTVRGTAFVSLGNANNDAITLTNNISFGVTALEEGQGANGQPATGPAATTSNGTNDTISVSGPTNGTSRYTSLYAAQDVASTPAATSNESIVISNIQIANVAATTTIPGGPTVPAGITTVQGNGARDVAVVKFVTTFAASPININLPLPPGVGYAGISETQGNGMNDSAEIETSTVTGGATITQGNGVGDIAAIVRFTSTGGTSLVGVPITITQGSGNADWAEVANVTAPNGNVIITQNDVATNASGDIALVLNTTVGTSSTAGTGQVVDFNGLVSISQGNAPGDIALVEGTFLGDGRDTPGTANNITITQGSNGGVLVSGVATLPNFNGSTVASDVAEINDETVTSNITITQGNGASVGSYVTAIANDYLGTLGLSGTALVPQSTGTLPTNVTNPANPSTTVPAYGTIPSAFTPVVVPSIGSSPVTAGGTTAILQTGAGNQVYLGDFNGSSFYSTFLNVYTGAGGSAYVQVLNTSTLGVDGTLGAPFSAIYNIEGGGLNSIYLDLTSLMWVDWDFATFIYIG
jgi:hypothetical protein